MQLLKLIFSTALIIFNCINFTNCFTFFSGGSEFLSYFSGDKLYYRKLGPYFFYVDLAGVSLDTDAVIDSSKWFDLNDIKPQPEDIISKPFLGGKANDKLIFLEIVIDSDYRSAYKFDTALNQWIIKPDQILEPKNIFISVDDLWISDVKTGKAYTFTSIFDGISIFDSINLAFTRGVSNPKDVFKDLNPIRDFVQVLIPNGQILYIGGGLGSFKQSMNSILTYDINTDTWQMMNTVGETPEGRIKHTAVSTSDGRVIVFGGISNGLPALPNMPILDTSKTPYEWSTPTVENPIGSFSSHTVVMAKNYMIFAFGKNESETISGLIDNKDIYKLDISDPSKYRWSLLSKFNDDTSVQNSVPIQATSGSFFRSKTRQIVIIIFIVGASVCLSILAFYIIRKYINKKKNKNTYQQNVSSNDELGELEEMSST